MSKAWTPILRGSIYCSSACGYNCRKADHDKAVRRANSLCKKMGKGWKPHVWENGGWYYCIKKGKVDIYPSHGAFGGGASYWAALQTTPQIVSPTDMKSAMDALRYVVNRTNLTIETLTKEISKVSGDAL